LNIEEETKSVAGGKTIKIDAHLTTFIALVEESLGSELETLRDYILKESHQSQTAHFDLAKFYDYVYFWAV